MEPRYLVDAMLGNVAKKLRMLGYDAEYVASGARLDAAASSGRILVTRNSALLGAAARRHVDAVTGDTERAIMCNILRGTHPVVSAERARCAVCNGRTKSIPASEALKNAPPGIIHTKFWECVSCGHLYWEGTHMRHVREAAEEWT